MYRYIILILLIFITRVGSAQGDSEINLSWAQDSVLLGGQNELTLNLTGVDQHPGSFFWDTTVVIPMDTTLKGDQLKGLWELAQKPSWTDQGNGQWKCQVPVQFWNAGLFYFSGINIMNEDSTMVVYHEEELPLAMMVQFPNSLQQSQKPVELRDIIPARHAHSESWIRMLWPVLLWTLFCLFIALLLGKSKYLIAKKDRILLSAERWWKESHGLYDTESAISKDRYASLSRKLRYWMEERFNIPAKEWTTAQLDEYAQAHPEIDSDQILFLHKVDEIVYGFGQPSETDYTDAQQSVHEWTQEYAGSMGLIERAREEVETILPDLVYDQSVDQLNNPNGISRLLASLIDLALYFIPLPLICVLSGCIPYFIVLKDSYGVWPIVISLFFMFLLFYIMVEAFWNYYSGRTVGARMMQHRLSVYPDYSTSYIKYLWRSMLKFATSPLFFTQINEKRLQATHDQLSHIYRESL